MDMQGAEEGDIAGSRAEGSGKGDVVQVVRYLIRGVR